jgi:DNA repair photolyase
MERFGSENEYGITLVSLDNNFKKRYEPNAAPYGDRLSALRFLHSKGLRTWVSIEPYPTPNIIEQDLQIILSEVSFVNKIIFGKMNYSIQSSQHKGAEAFYEGCVEQVINFCKRGQIEFHIKRDTSRAYDEMKENLLRGMPANERSIASDYRPNPFG